MSMPGSILMNKTQFLSLRSLGSKKGKWKKNCIKVKQENKTVVESHQWHEKNKQGY